MEEWIKVKVRGPSEPHGLGDSKTGSSSAGTTPEARRGTRK
jgi:hypothetical protein